MSLNDDTPLDASICRNDPQQARPVLAWHLNRGTLGLALGAGASLALRMPSWPKLVNSCLEKVGKSVLAPNASNTELLEATDIVENHFGPLDFGRSAVYRSCVRECLYRDVSFDSVLHSELLIALGALLMGSRRGSVQEVVNFNFDDVLEWYLFLHGYQTQIISKLPALRRACDATIYHPHGFLPFHNDWFDWSDFLVFSKHSYDRKMSDKVDPWSDIYSAMLKSKLVLFVGLSGDDPTFGPILVDIADRHLVGSRKTGVWLFGPNTSDARLDSLTKRNIVSLRFNDYAEIPKFLLEICQDAADLSMAR